MYINFQYLRKSGLNELDIIPLQIINQLKYEPELEDNLALVLDDERLGIYEEKGIITSIKGKSKDSELAKLRLTKKGKTLLDNIQTKDIDNEDIIIFNWLSDMYKKMGKVIGNQKKVKTGIAQFKAHTGIKGNKLALLLQHFISNPNNMKYNNKLEKAFYSSNSVFKVKFDLDDCRLHEYYQLHQEEINNRFNKVTEEE